MFVSLTQGILACAMFTYILLYVLYPNLNLMATPINRKDLDSRRLKCFYVFKIKNDDKLIEPLKSRNANK